EVVQTEDAIAASAQARREVRADEPGDAGEEDSHGPTLLPASPRRQGRAARKRTQLFRRSADDWGGGSGGFLRPPPEPTVPSAYVNYSAPHGAAAPHRPKKGFSSAAAQFKLYVRVR